METKRCPDCGEDRPISEFNRDARRRDGLAFYCRTHARLRLRQSKERRHGPPTRRYAVDRDVPEGHKWCPDCDGIKPLLDFPRSKNSASGRYTYCKPCHNARGKATLEAVGGARTYHLKRRYGITAAEADELLAAQEGVCAICRSAPAEHVDHDHATGAVRALLCFNCNGGLGQFRDDPSLLYVAAFYLEHHAQQQAMAALAATAERVPDGSADVGDRR